jgi:hypothetical protein
MSQFTTTRSNIGDMSIEAGVVIDLTAATTGIFNTARTNGGEAVPMQPLITGNFPSNRAQPRFAGGSSRNMLIETVINANIPSGWFKQIKKKEFACENPIFSASVETDGSLTWSDDTNVIMTAPAGSIPLDEIVCTALIESYTGGSREFNVELGSATGLVTLNFNVYAVPPSVVIVPCIFIVEYNATQVINTGYRGDSGTFDGVTVVAAGGPGGSVSFTKSTASPTFAKVRVVAPFTDSVWDFQLSCPGASSPPYTPSISGRKTFTATSTTYGNSLNGGTPFTLDVIYEGKTVYTEIEMQSVSLGGSYSLLQNTVNQWVDGSFTFYCNIDDDGDATISDNSQVIAIRPTVAGAEQYLDPTGSYDSTAYGRDTYNNGVDFSIAINMIVTPPLALYTYLKAAVTSGSITGVTGPFSAPTLPANTSGVKVIPISYSDGLGNITQFSEGAFLWK